MKKRLVAIAGMICLWIGAGEASAVCPKLQAEFRQRKQQLHHELVASRKAAHHHYQQQVLLLRHQRPGPELCGPERQAITRQISFQRQQAHRELKATLRRLSYENQLARQRLNAWYAGHRHGSYCGSCDVCRPGTPPLHIPSTRYGGNYGFGSRHHAAYPFVPGGGGYGSCDRSGYATGGRGVSFSISLGR